MREIVTETVARMVMPGAGERARAAVQAGSRSVHDRLLAEWPCLNSIELVGPDRPAPPADEIVVATWNMARCRELEGAAGLIAASGADIVLASGMDVGMARSAQVHMPHALAARLGFGYAFGVEAVALAPPARAGCAGGPGTVDRHGLVGNAILSRWPLEAAVLIPLDSGGAWFVGAGASVATGGPRVGGRMALAAQVATRGGTLTVVAAHLEDGAEARGRAGQAETLLAGLINTYPAGPAVIGGDLGARALLQQGGAPDPAAASRPARFEPVFGRFAAQGFGWKDANCGTVMARGAEGTMAPGFLLDWILVRGATAHDPFVLQAAACGSACRPDHGLVGTRIRALGAG